MTPSAPIEFDAKTETQLVLVYPGFSALLRSAMERYRRDVGRSLKITESLRSFRRQAELYGRGRSDKMPRVTDAKPRYSFHHYGVAADVAFDGADPYLDRDPRGRELWDAWVTVAGLEGLVSGGNWDGDEIHHEAGETDTPHVQATFGVSIESMERQYSGGGIRAVWLALDLARQVPPGIGWCGRNLFDPNKT